MSNFIALAATFADLWRIAFFAPFANSGLPFENYKRYAKTETTSSLALVLRNTHKKFQTFTFKNDGIIAETVKMPKKRFFFGFHGNRGQYRKNGGDA